MEAMYAIKKKLMQGRKTEGYFVLNLTTGNPEYLPREEVLKLARHGGIANARLDSQGHLKGIGYDMRSLPSIQVTELN